MVLRRRRSHPDVDAAGRGDVVAQCVRNGAAVDATDELVGKRPDRERVIEERLSRLPERPLRCEPLGQRCVREQLLPCEATVDSDQAGLVRQHLPDGHRALAALRELGPVRRDRRVEVELPALNEQCDHDRGGALAARVHGEQRVGLHPAPSGAIHDALGADVHAELGAVCRVGVAVRSERLVDGLEWGHCRVTLRQRRWPEPN